MQIIHDRYGTYSFYKCLVKGLSVYAKGTDWASGACWSWSPRSKMALDIYLCARLSKGLHGWRVKAGEAGIKAPERPTDGHAGSNVVSSHGSRTRSGTGVCGVGFNMLPRVGTETIIGPPCQ